MGFSGSHEAHQAVTEAKADAVAAEQVARVVDEEGGGAEE